MDGTEHFCEACGCTCDCGRDTDYDSCDYCDACNEADDYVWEWHEDYE